MLNWNILLAATYRFTHPPSHLHCLSSCLIMRAGVRPTRILPIGVPAVDLDTR